MKHNVIRFNVLDVNLNLFLLTFVKISNKLIKITVKLLSTEQQKQTYNKLVTKVLKSTELV